MQEEINEKDWRSKTGNAHTNRV